MAETGVELYQNGYSTYPGLELTRFVLTALSSTMTDGDQRMSLNFGQGQATAPAYVGARSANQILSSIRLTKIKSEALRSLNIFLDELLWLVLHSSRSLSTNRLKMGLLHIMPGSVGKDALLEAEVELRAYRERVCWVPGDDDDAPDPAFPLQPTFEVRALLGLDNGSLFVALAPKVRNILHIGRPAGGPCR